MASLEDALAATLRQLRETRGYSRTQVAAALGKTESAIARWETPGAGNRTPSPTALNNLSAIYETTPTAVYGRVERAARDAVPDEIRKRAQTLARDINKRHGRTKGAV